MWQGKAAWGVILWALVAGEDALLGGVPES